MQKIADKINLIRKPLKLNTASGATSGPTGKILCINLVCAQKLKQHLILRLDFAQRFKKGIDWDINGKLFLRSKGKKISPSMRTNDFGQWMIDSLKISTDEHNETEQKLCLITTNTVTIPPQHISLVPLKANNQAINTKFPSEALLEIEENPFLTIEQPELVVKL